MLELTDVTLRKAVIFAKVQGPGGFVAETEHTEMLKHATAVVFRNSPRFEFPVRVPIVEVNGELEKCECTITVRRVFFFLQAFLIRLICWEGDLIITI